MRIFLILSLVLLLLPANTAAQSTEPITYYDTDTALSTIDPQRADSLPAATAVEQLFLGLTTADPTQPGHLLPALAREWSVDDSGTIWTFTLRDDVPWVHWDSATGTAEIVRMVTAADAAYGIKRACDPRLGSYYTTLADDVILGCNELLNLPLGTITVDDYKRVQVDAPDDTTLIVRLQFPSAYFLSQTAMPIYRPVPQELIAEVGDAWIEPANLLTSGPFVLDEWTPRVSRVYLRNPHLPADLRGPGNVERVFVAEVDDLTTQFALYQSAQTDRTLVPPAELEAILNNPDVADQLTPVTTLGVFYFAFDYTQPPFDDVHARRAFSAAIDRTAFVQEVRQNRGIPMIHMTPPGVFGAPPINEVGVGYDPDYARAELEAAGYPNCEGFPAIDIAAYTNTGNWAEFFAAAVVDVLGCDPNLITFREQEFTTLIDAIAPTHSDRPNLWTMNHLPDYPDANNGLGDILACEGENQMLRPCAEVDDLITQAAREPDPDTRVELYYTIEAALFGPEGEQPIIPLFLEMNYILHQPWLTGPFDTDAIFSGIHYSYYFIDQAAQLAARAG
ncbi:MAG TPA: peptide ABC transporter substrate-binding protein [Aggregatilineaceae bacterium]|nr:peptide ABC transporter substrate-binding protein [Aggregatilineaceae bacterium]